ncbi:MAG: amidophosphoribosyltransferase [Peptoniphilaceae bacterium]|nr:amidophosphoribosyltransferase [Peptoniphilaceae bacterium]MDY6086126.1 amidophosphoribosyltransferase [Peptoniphilaceae bacterium]
MGGFFGVASRRDALVDVFYGTDYHSHLGTHRAGIASYDPEIGLQREIHDIENSPFRTRFEHIFDDMSGISAIGCVSDYDPQPLLLRSKFGTYALCFIGIITNREALIQEVLKEPSAHFDAMTGGQVNNVELIGALMNEKDTLVEGLRHAQEKIEGTASILILQDDGTLIAARDKMGRLPVFVGENEDGMCVSFESFPYRKLGYTPTKELGPGEIVSVSNNRMITLVPPRDTMKICAFLWTYYGYPNSIYEGSGVEKSRTTNGEILAKNDRENGGIPAVDYVGGVPDSGLAYGQGYAYEAGLPFGRAIIKYTPTWSRSFTPSNQKERNRVAHMKQLPVTDYIEGKDLLFVDDSIVRGTQLHETVDFLYRNGAKSVHMRSASPPVLFGCKYLNFSRSNDDMELLARRVIDELEGEEGLNHLDEYLDGTTERGRKMRDVIAEKFHFASLEYQTLEGTIEAIGLPRCKLCTYCWTGEEDDPQ